MCEHTSTGTHQGWRHQIPWSWSFRQLRAAQCGCWGPNADAFNCWDISKHFWNSLASVSFCVSVPQRMIFTAVFSSKEGKATSIMHVATTPFLIYLLSSLWHFWQVEFPVFYAHIAINLLDFFPFLLYQGISSTHMIKSVLASIFFLIFSICSLLSVIGPQWPQLVNVCGVQ